MKKLLTFIACGVIAFSVSADFTGQSTELGRITQIGVLGNAFFMGFEVRPNACKGQDWWGYQAKVYKNDENYEVIVSMATAAYFSKSPTVKNIRWDSDAQGQSTCGEHALHINTLLLNP